MRIYLDYNATTPVAPEVLEVMLPFLSESFGNASSIHSEGQRARAAVDRARESVASLIGAKPGEIVFTSGGTEADNLAIFGVVAASTGTNKHVITTAIEHHAVLNACQALQYQGADVTFVPAGREGIICPDEIRRAIRPETVLITVMHANNELGTIQPIQEIGRLAANVGICFHVDAVQSAGKLPLDVNQLGVDLLSLSAHKIYGPKGAGALYVRTDTPIEPQVFGGQHERGRRAGTENVPGIVGLGKATELARMNLAEGPARLAQLRDRFEEALLSAIPSVSVNGDAVRRLPNTTNLTFAGTAGEALVIALDLQNVACSMGAACSSGAVAPSHVLLAIGLSAEEARSTLRFSLGRPTTEEEIDAAIAAILPAVARLRALSPKHAAPAGVSESQ